MSYKRNQIVNLFVAPQVTMESGLWFSGEKGEGEFKAWYSSGELQIHSFFKNNKQHGLFKSYYKNGQLNVHRYYKNDVEDGENKEYNPDGSLRSHELYKKGKVIKTLK